MSAVLVPRRWRAGPLGERNLLHRRQTLRPLVACENESFIVAAEEAVKEAQCAELGGKTLEGAEVDVVRNEGDAQMTEGGEVGEIKLEGVGISWSLYEVLVAVEGEAVEVGSEMSKGGVESRAVLPGVEIFPREEGKST